MEGYFISRWVELVAIAGLGAFMGSFLNVVSLNVGQLRKIIWRRSACPDCEHVLRWYELIPLVSYIIQRGRCRRCSRRIAASYFWVEAATALLFGSLYWWLQPTMPWGQLLPLLAVVSVWAILFLDDWRTMSVDLGFAAWAGGITTVWYLAVTAIVAHSALPLLSALEGGLMAYVTLELIRFVGTAKLKREAMGSADPWIGLLAGLVLGGQLVWLFLLLSFVIGSLIGILPMLLTRRFDTLKEVPFAPSLLLAAWFTLLWGPAVLHWYLMLL